MKTYSQNGEDLILLDLYAKYPQAQGSRYFLDLGAGDGCNLSNSLLFRENGWHGLCVEGKKYENPAQPILNAWISCETLPAIVAKMEQSADLLMIDLDGNDYYILRDYLIACGETKSELPRVIVCEFNPAHRGSLAIKYNPNHQWQEDSYFGMTFGAVEQLAIEFGYDVYDLPGGINAILTRSDLRIRPKNWLFMQKADHPPAKRPNPVYVDLVSGKEVILR